MSYQLKISDQAKKDIQALDPVTQKRIVKKLKFFLAHDNPVKYAKKLTDNSGGDYRWRVGPYRLVFDIDKRIIKLLRVQHRREVYRK